MREQTNNTNGHKENKKEDVNEPKLTLVIITYLKQKQQTLAK